VPNSSCSDGPSVIRGFATGNPPEARKTFERLKAEGHSETEALHLVTAVLRTEMTKMLQQGKPFDDAAYTELLKKLPHV